MIPLNRNLLKLKRSGIRAYSALAAETPGCISLTLGEPEFDTPAPVTAAGKAALDGGKTHYAPNAGLMDLRRAIAKTENREPEEILVTIGASGALFTALLGILNPGDQVIVPMPAFPLYETIITMAGAEVVPLETWKDGFQIRPERLNALVNGHTKAILLNSPNNPTGVVYDRASMAAVKNAILGRPIFLLCDQVYQGLGPADLPRLTEDADLRGQLLLCQSFSKPYAMTG